MGLTERPDGLYVEFRVVDDGKTLYLAQRGERGKLKSWKVGSVNRTIAKKQEAIIKTELMKGSVKSQQAQAQALSFGEWALRYLELHEVKRLRSYRDRQRIIKHQLIPFFGSLLLADIKPEHIEEYRAHRMKATGTTPSLQTINNDHIILKHCLNVAIRRGLLPSNPASKVPLPDPHNEWIVCLLKRSGRRCTMPLHHI